VQSIKLFFWLQVNRDLISNEMQKMRQQLKYLQAELCARGGGAPSDEVQVLALYRIELLFDHSSCCIICLW
jgi:hypothetical protein